MKLHEILMSKARKNELAHFYLVDATGTGDADKALQEFVHHFIRDYYRDVEGHKQSLTNLVDHPDVFVLGNIIGAEDPVDSNFTVAESESLTRFFEFRPVQSKRKFAVITEGHRINSIVANKWLKLLEEPQGNVTIFLLNPRRQKLLDTIHSRAIHLRLPLKSEAPHQKEWMEFLGTVKGQSLAPFLEKNVRGDTDLSFWINELIQWEADQSDQPEAKMALEDWLKKFEEMDTFNQPAATKWTLFYSHLKQHVIPRVSLT